MCQYVLQHEHGVLPAVPVGDLQLSEHGADLRGITRYIDLSLIGFQDRVLGAPRLCPVDLALVGFRRITDDLLDVRLVVLFFIHRSHPPSSRLGRADSYRAVLC